MRFIFFRYKRILLTDSLTLNYQEAINPDIILDTEKLSVRSVNDDEFYEYYKLVTFSSFLLEKLSAKNNFIRR